MLWDAHIHTSFSGDCNVLPIDMINTAKSLGLNGITITDHLDLDYPIDPEYFSLDLPNYHKEITKLKNEVEDESFNLNFGIEIGLSEKYLDENAKVKESYPFDYCIGSIHVVDSKDVYFEDYYQGISMEDALKKFFECTFSNVIKNDFYDSLGHLDYIIRYARKIKGYESIATKELPFNEIIEEILLALIKKEKALEVNTGAFRYNIGEPNPPYYILKRYYEMGGRLITMGSDAHQTKFVGFYFNEVTSALKDIGFDSFTVYKNHIPNQLPL